MPPKNQKLYNYKAEQMEKALNAVRNEQQSIRKAAQIFNVPRTTLNDKVLGKTSDGRKHGKDPYLTAAEEEDIIT